MTPWSHTYDEDYATNCVYRQLVSEFLMACRSISPLGTVPWLSKAAKLMGNLQWIAHELCYCNYYPFQLNWLFCTVTTSLNTSCRNVITNPGALAGCSLLILRPKAPMRHVGPILIPLITHRHVILTFWQFVCHLTTTWSCYSDPVKIPRRSQLHWGCNRHLARKWHHSSLQKNETRKLST